MAPPNQNNTFLIQLSASNLTVSNVVIKPLETREGYPHGIRFANTYVVAGSPPAVQEPTYPITISNVGISQVNTTFAPIINTTSLNIGTTSVNSSLINVPLFTLAGSPLVVSTVGIVNNQIFTANGTWTKPAGLNGNEQVFIMMWGGGGSGSIASGAYSGGGGAACMIASLLSSTLANTISVTVGNGGRNTLNENGGNSIFGTMTALGGRTSTTAGVYPQGGSGWLTIAPATNTGGEPLGGAGFVGGARQPGAVSTFGGGGSGGNGGISIFGGGGGSYYDPVISGDYGYGGNSIYGGVGGSANQVPGTSPFAGTLGGGGRYINGVSTDGVRGEVRVWVLSG